VIFFNCRKIKQIYFISNKFVFRRKLNAFPILFLYLLNHFLPINKNNSLFIQVLLPAIFQNYATFLSPFLLFCLIDCISIYHFRSAFPHSLSSMLLGTIWFLSYLVSPYRHTNWQGIDKQKRMKRYLIIALAGVATLLTTCSKTVYNPDVCFQEDVLPIFITNCSMPECHSTQEHEAGFDFSNYDGIRNAVKPNHPLESKAYTTVNGNNPSMPRSPYPKLTTKQVNIIKIWINMGANNTSNCKSCDTTNFTFNNRIKVIMDAWCIGCHSATNSSGGYDLSTYTGVVNSITGNKLLGSLQHAAGYSPMPKNTSALAPCDVIAIGKWINSGYPNN